MDNTLYNKLLLRLDTIGAVRKIGDEIQRPAVKDVIKGIEKTVKDTYYRIDCVSDILLLWKTLSRFLDQQTDELGERFLEIIGE